MSEACASLAALPSDVDVEALRDPGLASRGPGDRGAGRRRRGLRGDPRRAARAGQRGGLVAGPRRDSPRPRRARRRSGCAGSKAPVVARAAPGAASRPSSSPVGLKARLAVLDRLIAAQATREQIIAEDELGREAFGRAWAGERSTGPSSARCWHGAASSPTRRCCRISLRLLAEVGDREPPILLADTARACSRRSAPTGRGWSSGCSSISREAFGEPRSES